ncbi:uncharacterized protein LOC130360947 [Hyla sarda]|uniref:uncharacterized protein LOC130360947 n=1 Tax=Hyla sarda TaxID=327740 RepID=UPI0024C2E206|nr:uncharacterized protein LOC130360947 [Hyla sarda]
MSESSSLVPTKGDELSLDTAQFMSASQIQDLINRSVQTALASAIMPSGSQPTLSFTPIPLPRSDEPPIKKGKASHKRKHTVTAPDSPAGEVNNVLQAGSTMDCHPMQSSDSNRPLGLRELPRRQKSARRTKPDSHVESSDEESEAESGETDVSESDYADEDAGTLTLNTDANPATQDEIILDALGEPLFHPDAISHPRSGDWTPLPHVSQYVEFWARRSLERTNRNKLRAECPRPFIPKKVVTTPEVDPILSKYLAKSGKFPKKGIERSFKTIQDRVLDLLGPLTKILNLAEQAAATNQPVDLVQLRGWAQRAICLVGSANTACSTERRRSILMRLDPQLAHLAETEPGPSAEGRLFGDTLVKDINKFVGLFNSLDKAQTSLKKSGASKIFPRAGRSRGRSAGRNSTYRPYARATAPPQYPQAPPPYSAPMAQPAPFFPPRGRPWRGRGSRGYPRSRPYTGY